MTLLNERESDGKLNISAISECKVFQIKKTDCKKKLCRERLVTRYTSRKEGGDLPGGYKQANIEINCEVDDLF